MSRSSALSDCPKESHWLYHYASDEYQWQNVEHNGRTTFFRPIGLVELAFDTDGRYNEGRADMSLQLDLEIASSLSNHDLRERILFAWTCLRCQHLLLQAKALPGSRFSGEPGATEKKIFFAVDAPRSLIQAIEDAGTEIVFLQDHFKDVDVRDFWTHCQNTARILDPEKALSKIFVHPLKPTTDGRNALSFLLVGSHSIWDGVSNSFWLRDLVRLINMPLLQLRQKLKDLIQPKALADRLPIPQEALYPPVGSNRARARWFWLLTRILRHVRRPLQAGFTNPLRRSEPRQEALPYPETYAPVLDYSIIPTLNCTPCTARLGPRATARLVKFCREANASVGSGCFALAALTMMEMHERREPGISLEQRQPFITGFPINPRPFLRKQDGDPREPDSLALAFSDGIALPFLPSHLPLAPRLRLLARQAHRQLSAFQKRAQDPSSPRFMNSSRSAGRVLANQYISSLERCESMLPPDRRSGVNPQGGYPARPNLSLQTCGVSSVGRNDTLLHPGMFDLSSTVEGEGLAADFRATRAGVRPREGEFLVGIGGSENVLGVAVSVDGCAMEEALVEEWTKLIEDVLERDEDGTRAKL